MSNTGKERYAQWEWTEARRQGGMSCIGKSKSKAETGGKHEGDMKGCEQRGKEEKRKEIEAGRNG